MRADSTYVSSSYSRLKRNPMALFGISLFSLILLMAIIGPILTPYSFYETHLPLKNSPPSREFWFGTDELGRDLFTRVWWGARISLFVGITAACIDLVIGVIFGSLAATLGGKKEEAMMRAADILNSIPYLLLVILLIVIIGPGLPTIIVALTVTGWIGMARITRSQILQLKQLDFITAARGLGAGYFRILLRHLVPNAMGPIITTMTMTVSTAIFTEAFLSFLGLGIQAPVASWGSMANDGLPALRYFPWRLFFPSTFVCLTLLSLNLLGEGLRDAFDPRFRQ